MKKIFLTMALAIGLMASAQVKIGANPTIINAASLLELENSSGTKQGLLLPRVALVSTLTPTLDGGLNVEGMTVYNTATAGDVTPGLYTNDGSKWVKVGGSSFVSATLTKDSSYTVLATADVTPNNITTITFSGAPSALALTNLPSGNIGKILNIFNIGSTPFTVNFNRGGDGAAASNSIAATRGTSFIWDGSGWSRSTY